ncbi:MAG: heme exporter protein CcmB [Calditrichaceae bacterium]|nr:heme exporter protein CcmB [Calditrichaceae bacterium]MBN2709393.1 heme exporter protein CcmB [Calditrichaceae bacterium]RQV95766.1 MAG: ABC transporter permease [Calditrichota bacterium]
MRTGSFESMVDAFYIFKKDLIQEFKTRYALNAIILFAVVTLTAVSFSIGVISADDDILCAMFWIILFFSSMSGLSHIFVREEETHTADTLKLVTCPTAVYLGKLLFNFMLLLALEIILVPLYFGLMDFYVRHLPLFLIVLAIGSVGLAGGGTIVAAIIAKASSRGALFTVLSFPVLLPLLISGISATRIAVNARSFTEASAELQTLTAYGVVVITVSILLFEFIWNE